jgi:autotransporter-associated beta strand protein
MNGLKQTYVGSGGAVIDTLGRNVGLSQRLMTLDAAADGGVTKLGLGTLTLAKPPCVTGRIDVQAGTLRMQSEPARLIPTTR